jgi:hypothetical protein
MRLPAERHPGVESGDGVEGRTECRCNSWRLRLPLDSDGPARESKSCGAPPMNEPGLSPATSALPEQGSGLLQNLARTNNFTMDDLAANRAGRLSTRQARRLRKRSAGYRLLGVLALLVSIGAGVWFVVTLNATNAQPIHSYSVVASILFGLIGVGSLRVGRSRARDVQGGSVNAREGILKLVYQRSPTTGTGGGGPTYLYVIGGASYRVSLTAWEGAITDLRYRVHETPDGVLLSIEPLGAAPIASPPPPTPPPPASTTPALGGSLPLPPLRFAPASSVRAGPSATLTGHWNSPPQPFSTRGGLVVLDVTCSGSGTAGIRILSASGEEMQPPMYANLADQGGFLRASWGTHLEPGQYFLGVHHIADLALSRFRWKAVIAQPGVEGSVSLPITFKGRRRAIVGPFSCSDSLRLAAHNKTRDRRYVSFSVEVLASDGRATDAVKNGPPDYRGAVVVRGLTPGAHWLNVDSDGSWVVSLSSS